MASKLIGRAPCPECGFGAAHVKQSEKTLYRYCPECGAQYFPRGEEQTQRLRAAMKPAGAAAPEAPKPAPAAAPASTTKPAAPAPSTVPAPAPEPPKKSALFGW